MPEAKQKSFAESMMARTARNIVEEREDQESENSSSTRERQGNSDAFSLEVKFKDGRRKQTFPWALYAGHEWTDEEGMECLTVLFGMRVLIIKGYNFEPLNRDLTLGKLTSIREHNSHQVEMLKRQNADNVPVIVEIEAHPNYRQMVAEIKGDEHDTGKSGKAAR
jgi:hypothetical protein